MVFTMPAPCDVVFDVFHYHQWRVHWDSLVARTAISDGAPCPSVGAVSTNHGLGLSMTTRFVAYERPRLAAAVMVGRSFPFTRWAASMKHEALDAHHSLLIYTYTIEAGPAWCRWFLEPAVKRIFALQTRKRFARMENFLATSSAQVTAWQRSYHNKEV